MSPTNYFFSYDKNNIAFDFIAIHLRSPDAIHYQYKLEGFDKEWSEILRDNKVNYTNFPSGNYKFIVRESEDPNYWKKEITSVLFVVSPAYWKTIWFTVSELSILILLILSTIALSRKIQSQILKKLLIFACVFVIFEYIHTQFEPYMEDIAGGPAIFQVSINLLLGLMLFPVESSNMKYLNMKTSIDNTKNTFASI